MWVVGPRGHIPTTWRKFSVLDFRELWWGVGSQMQSLPHCSSCPICRCGALLLLRVSPYECSLSDQKCTMWIPFTLSQYIPSFLSSWKQALTPKVLACLFLLCYGASHSLFLSWNLHIFSMGWVTAMFLPPHLTIERLTSPEVGREDTSYSHAR